MCRCGCVTDIKKCYTRQDGSINIKLKWAIITSIATTVFGTIIAPIYMYYGGKADHESTVDILQRLKNVGFWLQTIFA
jgi:hypothetical protein